MNLTDIGLTLDLIGVLLLGITLLRVHGHVSKEHKIDDDVIKAMNREKLFGMIAMLFIILGYLLQLLD